MQGPSPSSKLPPGPASSGPASSPAPASAATGDPWAVKRSLGRCWGSAVLSFGLWQFFWFHNYRNLLDGEMGERRDDALLHTFGLLVPILNYFIIYWLWRDLDILRRRVGLPEFPVGLYLVGAIFLAPVAYSFANQRLNEYWEVRSQGHATDAPVTTGEKIFIGIGMGLFLLYLAFIVLALALVVTDSSSS